MRCVSFDAVDYRIEILLVDFALNVQNPFMNPIQFLIEHPIGDNDSDQGRRDDRQKQPLPRSHR